MIDPQFIRSFTARATHANEVSLDRPGALTTIEEEILHLKDSKQREVAQSILLETQDALRMFPPGVPKSFNWIACLPIELDTPAAAQFSPTLASAFYDGLNAAVADIPNSITAEFAKARYGAPYPLRLMLHSLERFDAESRAWTAFYAALDPNDESAKQYALESLSLNRNCIGIFVPLPDSTMNFQDLHNEHKGTVPDSEFGREIMRRISRFLERWNREQTAKVLPASSFFLRLSAATLWGEEIGAYYKLKSVLAQRFRENANTFDAPLTLVVGSTRIAKPFPGQSAFANLFYRDSGRLIAPGFCSLLAGTPLIVAERAAKRLYGQFISIGETVIAESQELVQKLTMEAPPQIPCPDGKYRPIQQAYYGKGAWHLKSLDWADGWKYEVPFNYAKARAILGHLPHPIAMIMAGADEAVRAHYNPELLAQLREQLAIPGRSAAVAKGRLFLWDENLAEMEDEVEDSVLPPDGVYAALHWKAAHGALLVVRKTLVDRLNETEMDSGFPAMYLHSPYPDAYFQFEEPLTRYRADGGKYSISGFYVSEETAESVGIIDYPAANRLFTITFSYRQNDEALRIGAIDIPFIIETDDQRDLTKTIREHMGEYIASLPGMAEDDIADLAFTHDVLALATKIFLYANLRTARKEEHSDRSRLLQNIKKLKGSQRDKATKKLQAAYDYILLGPEETNEDQIARGMRDRKMPVHWRKGFFRNQAHGPGLSLRKHIWVAPVLVNASNLGQEPSPEPKPYILE